jgi:GNAT superfamily N-acetyltransferase
MGYVRVVSMKSVAADEGDLNEYGLPELSFVVHDPENTRYVVGHATFAYIKEDEDTVGFMAFHEEEEQIIIYYIVFDEKIDISKAAKFIKEICSKKREAFILTYDCNRASQLFEKLGFRKELGLQYVELDHIPHFRSLYALEYAPISLSKIPTKIAALYNACFSETDGKAILEGFVLDPVSKTGNTFILRREGENIGFWIDVTYFHDLCFNCWIGIIPEHRRKGYGTQLMEYALTSAQKKGCTKAGLLVNPKNVAAVEFYKDMGYEKKWGRVRFHNEPE